MSVQFDTLSNLSFDFICSLSCEDECLLNKQYMAKTCSKNAADGTVAKTIADGVVPGGVILSCFIFSLDDKE